jgi:hypothetical protein
MEKLKRKDGCKKDKQKVILMSEGRVKKGAMMEVIYQKMKKNKGAEKRRGRQTTKHLKLEESGKTTTEKCERWRKREENKLEDATYGRVETGKAKMNTTCPCM